MLKNLHQELQGIRQLLADLASDSHIRQQSIIARTQQLFDLTAAIRPSIDVQLTDQQTAQLVNRLNDPLILPADLCQLIRENVRSIWYQSSFIPMGADSIRLETELRPDGTFQLVILYPNGAQAWRGTFHGPGILQQPEPENMAIVRGSN